MQSQQVRRLVRAYPARSLVSAGATHIFPENLAAGLALATQTLLVLGIPAREALERIRTLRAELSPELGALPPGTEAG